ncbi:MAG: serine/threonine-protein kinase [Bradymonadales bacterium]|jgi:serine/threonine protein kinase
MYGKASLDPLIGQLFAERYLVVSLIASGGMGSIYQASDTQTGQVVALKVLRKDFSAERVLVQRFLREAKALSALKHPHICQSYDSGYTKDGRHYITMELLSGRSLDKIIAKDGRLSVADAVLYIKQAASGLFEAHTKEIIHRDLKPANIFILEVKDVPSSVKILDFGIAKYENKDDKFAPKLTEAGTTLGTPYYMSPEQIRGSKVDARSDIYSLATILWECIFGEPPFKGKTPLDVFAAKLEKKLPKLPKELEKDKTYAAVYAVLAKALQRAPERRYASMREFERALEDIPLDAESAISEYFDSKDGQKRKTPTIDNLPIYRRIALYPNIRTLAVAASIISFAVFLVIYLISYSIPSQIGERPPTYQSFKFYSSPPADVWLDDKIIARSPASIDLDIEPPYHISFKHPNHSAYNFTILKRSREVQGLYVELDRSKATQSPTMRIDTIPPGATVFINGEMYPLPTPVVVTLVGRRNVYVSLSLDGYITENITVASNGGDVNIQSTLFPE